MRSCAEVLDGIPIVVENCDRIAAISGRDEFVCSHPVPDARLRLGYDAISYGRVWLWQTSALIATAGKGGELYEESHEHGATEAARIMHLILLLASSEL